MNIMHPRFNVVINYEMLFPISQFIARNSIPRFSVAIPEMLSPVEIKEPIPNYNLSFNVIKISPYIAIPTFIICQK